MILHKEALGESGKEELPFNRKRLGEGQPSAMTGWGMGALFLN